jgi:hypothetical protein
MLNFREMSEARLRQLAQTDQGLEAIELFSVPLTAAEERLLVVRDRLAEEGGELEDLVLLTREGYGGMYIDHARHGLVVQFTFRLDGAHRRELLSHFTDGRRVFFEVVEHSLIELRESAIELSLAPDRPSSFVGASVDVSENALRIDVLDVGATAPSDAGSSIDEFLNSQRRTALPIVRRTVPGPSRANLCTSRLYCSNPLRGGTRINVTNPIYNGTWQSICTSGFNATDSSGTEFVLTAGHCSVDGLARATISPYVQQIGGYSSSETIFVGPNGLSNGTDAIKLKIPESQKSHHIYRRDSQNYWSVNVVKRTGFVEDQLVCISSPNLGYRCGPVTDAYKPNVQQLVLGPLATQTHVLGYAVEYQVTYPQWGLDCGFPGGDSGAPVMFRHRAYGIHIGCVDTENVGQMFTGATEFTLTFTAAKQAELATGTTIRTSS